MKLSRIAPVVGTASIAVIVACAMSQSDRAASSSDTPVDPVAATHAVSAIGSPPIFDWSDQRLPGRQTHDLSAGVLRAAAGVTPKVDFNLATGTPVTSAPATAALAWTSSNAADKLFFGTNGAGGTNLGITSGTSGGATATGGNFFGLNNLYNAGGPNVIWSVVVGTGIDRSAVTISLDATKVYFVDTGGTLHCLLAASGANCSTTSTWTDYAGGHAVHGSSPWVDYSTGAIYYGDDSGYLHHISSTGALVWATQLMTSSSNIAPIESSPVEVGGIIYVGDDEGQLFRVQDYTAHAPAPGTSDVAVFVTCSAIGNTSAPCPGYTAGTPDTPSPWALRAAIGFDIHNNHAYAVADGYAFELYATGSWTTTNAPKALSYSASNTAPMYSAPATDTTNGFLYTVFNNALFKITYPFTGSATTGFWTTALQNTGTTDYGNALPYSVGTNISGVYVGDADGYAERFDCTTIAGTNALDGQTTSQYGTSINTPMILDWSSGDVNFGYTNGSGGGLVQFPLPNAAGGADAGTESPWACPSGEHLCTTSPANGPTNACQASSGNYGDACRGCCTTADCGSGYTCASGACTASCPTHSCAALPHTTSACTSNTCVYTCVAGWANCTGNISTIGCTVNTKTDANNCGGCGLACSDVHVPFPVCAGSVCTGHCADGWVHCGTEADGGTLTRQQTGCETAAACGTGGCCPNRKDGYSITCSTGQTCFDTGSNTGNGVCMSGQTTQAFASNSQNETVTVSCPSTTKITAITFADFGTPAGAGGYNWSSTADCGLTNTTGCAGSSPTTGCEYLYGTRQCLAYSCEDMTTQSACNASRGCAWAGTSPGSETGTCTSASCYGLASQATCQPTNCLSYTTQSACATEGSTITSTPCSGFSTAGTCAGSCAGGSASNCPPSSSLCSAETATGNCPSLQTTCNNFTTAGNCPTGGSTCSALSTGSCATSATTCAAYTTQANCPLSTATSPQVACSSMPVSICSGPATHSSGACSTRKEQTTCSDTTATCNGYDTVTCGGATCGSVTTQAACTISTATCALKTLAQCTTGTGCTWDATLATPACVKDSCLWDTVSAKCESDGCAYDTTNTVCSPQGCFWNSTTSACQNAACNLDTKNTQQCQPTGCEWNSGTSTCLPAGCALNGNANACESVGCSWNGTSCESLSCYSPGTGTCLPADTGCTWSSTNNQCQSVNTGCSWDSVNSICYGPSGCTWDKADSVCIANNCAWDSSLGLCASNVGYLHDYGSLSCSGGSCSGACAMDVAASSTITSACVGQNSCAPTAGDGDFATSNGSSYSANGTITLPFASGDTGYVAGQFYTDPCVGIQKSLSVQATCGTCP